MADGEDDFSALPLPDRFSHKVRFCRYVMEFQRAQKRVCDSPMLTLKSLTYRTGKCVNRATKMPKHSLRKPLTNRIRYLCRFCKTLACGKGLLRIPMWLRR